jgi:hypothetical protein
VIDYNIFNYKFLWIVLLLMPTFAACSISREQSPEEQIRSYFFQNQPVTGPQFVKWANENLADYSNRRVYKALYNVGKSHAELGHPNAIAMLSSTAQAWADAKGLPYSTLDWVALQQIAIDNIREPVGSEVKFWSED